MVSFVVVVVEKDKVVYVKGFGYVDYDNKVKVDENILYVIGFCSKVFIFFFFGLLREDGKLDFDDSFCEYIFELFFYNLELNDLVIIKDMMSYCIGLL